MKRYKFWSQMYPQKKDELLSGKGIYILFGKGDQAVSYPFDQDDSKILYIGKAQNGFINRYGITDKFRKRSQEINTYMGKSSSAFNHHCLYYILDIEDSGALRFSYRNEHKFEKGYLKGLRPELLLLQYDKYSESSIRQDEKFLLRSFRNRYGSLPPFNSTGPSFNDAADCSLNPDKYKNKIKPADYFLNEVQDHIQSFKG